MVLLFSISQKSYGMIAKYLILNKNPHINEIKKLVSQDHDINAPYPAKEWKSKIYGGCTPLQIACKIC